MKKGLLTALCAFSLVCASAADKSSEAIVTLLNSRASGSRSEFREAAKIVAASAKEGRPLQQFVIALVANDKDLPRKLRLKPETRREARGLKIFSPSHLLTFSPPEGVWDGPPTRFP